VYVVMAIVFVVLSIAIFTAKPTTKTQESALSIPKTH